MNCFTVRQCKDTRRGQVPLVPIFVVDLKPNVVYQFGKEVRIYEKKETLPCWVN